MKKEWLPLLAITLAGAVAIWVFALRPDSGADDMQPGRMFLVPVYPIGPVAEPPKEFRWRPLAPARKYVVEVFDQSMQSIWSGETAENSLACPPEVRERMVGGEPLFFQVRAHGRFGRELVASERVFFRLSTGPEEG